MTKQRQQPERMPEDELDRYRDAEWALHDSDTLRKYAGEWVVAFQRKVIAHGNDPVAVLEEATRAVRDQAHRVVLCIADEGDSWLQHTSDASVVFPDA